MKKPKKFESEYYNYKVSFSLVLLALVNVEYRLLWVDVESSGSSSDVKIFNYSKLRKKVKDGTFGLPAPEPLVKGIPDLHYFYLVTTPLP